MWSLFSRSAAASLPYETQECISEDERSIWKLHKGKRKSGGEEVSIFLSEDSGSSSFDMARVAIKRLKTLKHPCILTYLDSLEADKSIYLVTEAVSPLLSWLKDNAGNRNLQQMISWGLYQVTKGLAFMNNDGKLAHNNICASSIFVTRAGEWKISGLEYSSADPDYVPIKILPKLLIYDPPDAKNARKSQNIWSADVWRLGCLIWETFNGTLEKASSLQQTSKIPKTLTSTYCELVSANVISRPNPQDVIDRLRKHGQYFSNDLIDTLSLLEEIHIMSDTGKNRFFTDLPSKIDNIPNFICINKVLPALLKSYEFSNVGSMVLTPLFKIGQMLNETAYQSEIVPCVIKMFSSTDRSTRMKLLQQMEALSEHLDNKIINDQIFQPIINGFLDTNPAIRESTIKAILHLSPKLNHHNLNTEVLKHFARLQSRDDQGGIRTNTTVCLGKIASFLHPDTRQKCLVSAFTRAMKDPFPPARVAGVTALAATQQYYPLTDVATKIIPSLSFLTVDPEKAVRDAVFRVIKGFITKLEKVSEDPDLKEVMEKEVSSASSTAVSAANWAGWAVGTLASKFYKGSAAASTQKTESQKSSSESAKINNTSTDSSLETNINRSNQWNKDQIEEKSAVPDASILTPQAQDGWSDDDGWESFVDTEEKNAVEASHSVKSSSEVSAKDFPAFENTPASSSVGCSSSSSAVEADDGWNDWTTNEDSSLSGTSEITFSKADELKKQKEERKLQRQKEIEAKRATRAGPMKLGARKL